MHKTKPMPKQIRNSVDAGSFVSPVSPTFIHRLLAHRIMMRCARQKQIVAGLMLVICRRWQPDRGG